MTSDKPTSLLKSLNFFYLALLFSSLPLMLLFYGVALLCLRLTLAYVTFFDSRHRRSSGEIKESALQRDITRFLKECEQ